MLLGAPGRPRPRNSNFELWSWLFMRISGFLLIVLVLVHLFFVHIITPIQNVDFAFVASRWDTPFWRWYDLSMLGLAMIHGLNGVRVVADDYIHSPGWRLVTMIVLWAVLLLFILIGAQVILSFTPGPQP